MTARLPRLRRPHGRRGGRTVCRLAAVTAVILALCPGLASAHAQLLSTSPANNAVLAHEPSVISFTFAESVGIDGDAVRVFDHDGRRADTGGTFHPGGRGPTVGVHLRPDLPDGTYTATYRVVSADTHIVTGGFVFSIGARNPEGAATLTHLLAGQRSGPVSDTAFAAARAVQYAAIGIAAGLFAFLLLIWPAALERAGPTPDAWRTASTRYLQRAQTVLEGCCVAGMVSALVGIVLQGAEARGVDFWHAVGTTAVRSVLPTRFGIVWGAGFIAWLIALLALMAPLSSWSAAGLIPRDATLGATGAVLPRTRLRTCWPLAALGIPLVALLALPAMAGHATIQHPVALFAPVNVIHVATMSAWLGGLVGLVIGAFTLPSEDNVDSAVGTRTLAGALARFSPIALTCVGVLIATGIVQALIEVSAWSQFIDTGYGRAILVKVAALVVLIALGDRQRQRTIPMVNATAEAGAPPAKPAKLLVQTVGAELVALAVVLGAVGSLAGSSPAREHNATSAGGATSTQGTGMGAMPGMAMPSSGAGPARTTTIGAARLAVSVTPARVGQNTITLTLSDPRTGRPYTATKQLTVTATLTRQQIGPLTLHVHRTGPGQFATTGAVLGAPGTWTLQVTNRTSAFDETQRSIQVLIN